MTDAKLGPIATDKGMDAVVPGHPRYPQANTIAAEILRGPVRPAIVGDHDTQAGRAIRLIFHRGFQPAIRGQADHQTGLIILMDRFENDFRLNGEIAAYRGQQTWPAIHAETVMGALPEIRAGGGGDDKPV